MARCTLFVILAATLTACASGGQRSTRLTASDFDVTVAEMAADLAASDFLASRGADSPEIRIVTRQVWNLTSDVISPAEQWMMIARVEGSLPVQEIAQRKNIVFQIPPEEAALLRAKGFQTPLAEENRPTHLMTAIFRSSTRAGKDLESGFVNLRKDYYLLEYQILEIQSGRLEWDGRFEFAREADGLVID